MARFARPTAVLVALASAALLAGCADVVDGKPVGLPTAAPSSPDFPTSSPVPTAGPTPPPTPTPTAPTTPARTSTPPAKWIGVRDKRTGITFQLPEKPRTHSSNARASDGTPIVNTIYTYESRADPRDGIIVGVTSGSSEPIVAIPSKFGGVGTTLVKDLKASGASDAKIVGRMKRTVKGHTALCYRVAYTPLAGDSATPAWRICEIDAGHAIVSTQVVIFPPVGHAPAGLSNTNTIQTRLLASLSLS